MKVDFATALWVTPLEILGGNVGVSLSLPFGEPAVRAGAVFSGPILNRLVGRPVGISASDSTFNYGDPVLSTMVGWHAGNWHWKVAAAINIPAGAYQPGELSNVALNRWLGDFSGAITYLDPILGIDLSAAESRRNLLTRGVDVNELVGRRFAVGEVECAGIELCEPCRHLEGLTRPGVLKGLVHRGGLRAAVVRGGDIAVGDPVRPL